MEAERFWAARFSDRVEGRLGGNGKKDQSRLRGWAAEKEKNRNRRER